MVGNVGDNFGNEEKFPQPSPTINQNPRPAPLGAVDIFSADFYNSPHPVHLRTLGTCHISLSLLILRFFSFSPPPLPFLLLHFT